MVQAAAAGSRLQAAGYSLQAVGCRLQAIGYRLQASAYRLRATASDFRLQAAVHRPQASWCRVRLQPQVTGDPLGSQHQAIGSGYSRRVRLLPAPAVCGFRLTVTGYQLLGTVGGLRLQAAGHRLCSLQVTVRSLQATSYRLQSTGCRPWLQAAAAGCKIATKPRALGVRAAGAGAGQILRSRSKIPPPYWPPFR